MSLFEQIISGEAGPQITLTHKIESKTVNQFIGVIVITTIVIALSVIIVRKNS